MTTRGRGFSLVEIIIVVVILGILAALVVPQFSTATGNARTTSVESTLATVRGSIASYRTRAIVSGGDPYPSLNELNTRGVILAEGVPANPFTGAKGVQSVTLQQAQSRTVVNESAAGWCYYVNNDSVPPQAIFYANTSEETAREDGTGTIAANRL